MSIYLHYVCLTVLTQGLTPGSDDRVIRSGNVAAYPGELSSSSEIGNAMAQTGMELYSPHGFVGMILINGFGDMVSPDIFREINAAPGYLLIPRIR